MVTFDQPELIEPEVELNDNEAGADAPATGDGPASVGDEDSEGGGSANNSGFVPIAVGLAALLPLPVIARRRY